MIFNVGAGGGASTADKVKYNNTESGLQSDNVQGAVDELNSSLAKMYVIKVKCDSEFLGATVTVTNGSESYSQVVPSTLELVFRCANNGLWTISENINNSSATINTSFYGVYEVSLSAEVTLYNNGNECTDITGGWTLTGYSLYGKSNTALGTKYDTYFFIKGDATTSGDRWQTVCGTVNKIDFTGKTKLHIKHESSSSVQVCVLDNKSFSDYNTGSIGELSGTSDDYVIDISSVTGEHYLAISAYGNSSVNSKVYQVWMD